ncbi:MAG: DNA repair protein RecN [Weeksellaceae bacterium]
MLTRLSVSNFAIIDKLELRFFDGLTIITGETGAGKSILLGALKLILGERANLKDINDASKKCVIEANFDIQKLNLQLFFEQEHLDNEPETILRRELLPGGKSRAFINDTPVTLSVLKSLGDQLIDIHSQFNTANLFNQNYQLRILDAYAGQLSELKDFQELFSERKLKKAELKDLKAKLSESEREADYRQFLLNELTDADLKEEELASLESEQQELGNIEEIQLVLGETDSRLDSPEFGILSLLDDLTGKLHKISNFGESFSSIWGRMNSVRIELKDLHDEIISKLQKLESNPQRLEEINERLNLLNTLLHKHSVQEIPELIEIRNNLESKNSDFQQLEIQIEKLDNEIQNLEVLLREKAEKLSTNRKKALPKVEKEILESLFKLGMNEAVLKIELQQKSDLGHDGNDAIRFLFSANKGADLKPIEDAISGGERSRVMLSVKKSLAGKLDLPTLILDEIDTGVSGKIADEVGKVMKEMAKNLQLISITHLPQVAAKGDHHLKVEKVSDRERTTTRVVPLDGEARIKEIAELISGSKITQAALEQAEKLIRD